MGAEIESLEERLKSFLGQLEAECGVFERLLYKNKNQHRRSSYFQYLLKVRRDLRLLQSTKLEEILGSCFQVITGRIPKQKVHLLESLKWRKSDCGRPNFMERLLGAARLSSQIVEPMLKAATEVSTLLASSFFMGFSVTILALLARLRVLVQQILVDVVTVFNMVSSLSHKKQSVKIIQEGIEVFREYYPTNKEIVILECVWETDKFVLLEKTEKFDLRNQGEHLGDASAATLALRYQCLEFFLGDDDSNFEKAVEDATPKEGFNRVKEDEKYLFAGPSPETEHGKQAEDHSEVRDNPVIAGTPDTKQSPEGGGSLATTSSSLNSPPSAAKSSAGQVAYVSVKRPPPSTPPAFVSVKKPAISAANVTEQNPEENVKDRSNEDSFFALLTGGNLKDSLF